MSDKPDLTTMTQAIFALAEHRLKYRTKEIYSFCTDTWHDQIRISVPTAHCNDGTWSVRYRRTHSEKGNNA